jgi:hypothetical protein
LGTHAPAAKLAALINRISQVPLALAQTRANSDRIELEFKDGLGISLESTAESARPVV